MSPAVIYDRSCRGDLEPHTTPPSLSQCAKKQMELGSDIPLALHKALQIVCSAFVMHQDSSDIGVLPMYDRCRST